MDRGKEYVDQLVWRLMKVSAPKVMVLLVLTTIWSMDSLPEELNLQALERLQWCEFFAGQAEATKAFKANRFTTADLLYMNAAPGKQNPMDICSDAGFVTAIATVLMEDDITGRLCHFGLKCAKFTTINTGTSGRSACSAIGNLHHRSVLEGNRMASRVVLLILLVVCCNGTFLLEQPAQSFLEYYPRFRDLLEALASTGGRHCVPRLLY
ncbi:unnamed protein product [Durusdinium trenchii]|uniref:Uncharacterized protein n=1 Tax=Durusdinium trenchii TaxID=1381693 RepID=A0ABP0M462_9DINO